jgi:hypothetical protein
MAPDEPAVSLLGSERSALRMSSAQTIEFLKTLEAQIEEVVIIGAATTICMPELELKLVAAKQIYEDALRVRDTSSACSAFNVTKSN